MHDLAAPDDDEPPCYDDAVMQVRFFYKSLLWRREATAHVDQSGPCVTIFDRVWIDPICDAPPPWYDDVIMQVISPKCHCPNLATRFAEYWNQNQWTMFLVLTIKIFEKEEFAAATAVAAAFTAAAHYHAARSPHSPVARATGEADAIEPSTIARLPDRSGIPSGPWQGSSATAGTTFTTTTHVKRVYRKYHRKHRRKCSIGTRFGTPRVYRLNFNLYFTIIWIVKYLQMYYAIESDDPVPRRVVRLEWSRRTFHYKIMDNLDQVRLFNWLFCRVLKNKNKWNPMPARILRVPKAIHNAGMRRGNTDWRDGGRFILFISSRLAYSIIWLGLNRS